MKRFSLPLFSSLLLVVLYFPLGEAGQFHRRSAHSGVLVSSSHQHFIGAPVVAITPVPSHFVRFGHFTREILIVPHHHFVGRRVIISDPFFCFNHGIAFINEASLFEHLHQIHGISLETIPSVVVHSGSQVFFFGQ